MTFKANGNISTKSDIVTTAFGYGNNERQYALTIVSSTGVIRAYRWPSVSLLSKAWLPLVQENTTPLLYITAINNGPKWKQHRQRKFFIL